MGWYGYCVDGVSYEIRHLISSYWYCILWVSFGQNIFVPYASREIDPTVYDAVRRFEQGMGDHKTLKDLYDFAYDRLGYGHRREPVKEN